MSATIKFWTQRRSEKTFGTKKHKKKRKEFYDKKTKARTQKQVFTIQTSVAGLKTRQDKNKIVKLDWMVTNMKANNSARAAVGVHNGFHGRNPVKYQSFIPKTESQWSTSISQCYEWMVEKVQGSIDLSSVTSFIFYFL